MSTSKAPRFVNPSSFCVYVPRQDGSGPICVQPFSVYHPSKESPDSVFILEGEYYANFLAPVGQLAPFPETGESAAPVVEQPVPADAAGSHVAEDDSASSVDVGDAPADALEPTADEETELGTSEGVTVTDEAQRKIGDAIIELFKNEFPADRQPTEDEGNRILRFAFHQTDTFPPRFVSLVEKVAEIAKRDVPRTLKIRAVAARAAAVPTKKRK